MACSRFACTTAHEHVYLTVRFRGRESPRLKQRSLRSLNSELLYSSFTVGHDSFPLTPFTSEFLKRTSLTKWNAFQTPRTQVVTLLGGKGGSTVFGVSGLCVGNNRGAAVLSHRSWSDQEMMAGNIQWERQGTVSWVTLELPQWKCNLTSSSKNHSTHWEKDFFF